MICVAWMVVLVVGVLTQCETALVCWIWGSALVERPVAGFQTAWVVGIWVAAGRLCPQTASMDGAARTPFFSVAQASQK